MMFSFHFCSSLITFGVSVSLVDWKGFFFCLFVFCFSLLNGKVRENLGDEA